MKTSKAQFIVQYPLGTTYTDHKEELNQHIATSILDSLTQGLSVAIPNTFTVYCKKDEDSDFQRLYDDRSNSRTV